MSGATLEIDRLVEWGTECERRGDRIGAIDAYAAATRIVNNYPPAASALDRIARVLFAEAIAVRDAQGNAAAIPVLVRAVEIAPRIGEIRAELERLLALEPPTRDLTRECFIFPDHERATAWYREIIQTCLDFVAYGGIDGAIYEFGVLAGWTARLFAEFMRDLPYLGDLWLFDSFDGLPRKKTDIDIQSYDVARGIWREEMAMPDSILAEIGGSVDRHIRARLTTVISEGRLHIRKGLFSESLREPLTMPAAIVHLDCDLHQSTKEVLDALGRDAILQDGTILMFDDWNCNRANPAFGQRRAFAEFLEAQAGRWSASLFRNYGFNSTAFILHDGDRRARAGG